jgi:hypothetical protein
MNSIITHTTEKTEMHWFLTLFLFSVSAALPERHDDSNDTIQEEDHHIYWIDGHKGRANAS